MLKLNYKRFFKSSFVLFSFSFLMLGIGETVKAQSKKALYEANTYFDAFDYNKAIQLYRDILLEDNSPEAKIKLAESYRLTHRYEKAEYWYKQILDDLPKDPIYKLHFARILQNNGKCDEAKRWFLEYGQFSDLGTTLAKGCDQLNTFEKNKFDYKAWLLPVNTSGADFSPNIYQGGVIFASNRDKGGANKDSRAYLDLYYSEKQRDNTYSPPVQLKGKVNSSLNDGPANIQPRGTKLYFTRNSSLKGKNQKSKEGTITLNIYSAELTADGKWENLKAFQHNSSEYSVAHPTISSDGQNIFFISDMRGGYGGNDIYMCTKIDTFWSKPINLGPDINTEADEMFPYLHSDGTLFFSSNGHPGLGGFDIFTTKRIGGQWNEPKNMGIPFNSLRDDFGISTDKNKEKGYFSSNREGGFGSDDIYYFSSNNSSLASNSIVNDVELVQPALANAVVNSSIGMGKLYFEPGDWTISPNTSKELDKLGVFLEDNPEVDIELGAHTDSRGDDFVNKEVSMRRAQASRDYLLLKDIAPDRVLAKGYGEDEIINKCKNNVPCKDKEHEFNNRVEVKILGISGGVKLDLEPSVMIDPDKVKNDKIELRIGGKALPDLASKTESASSNSGVLNPTIAEDPYLDLSKLEYKVFIGPYKTVDNSTYFTFAELNTEIDLVHQDKGMMVALGPYTTIAEAEKYQQYAIQRGAKKSELIVFRNKEQTEMSVKKLKKLGAQ